MGRSRTAATTTEPSFLIESLTASTTYYYQVKSTDLSGNSALSDESTFKTLAETTEATE